MISHAVLRDSFSIPPDWRLAIVTFVAMMLLAGLDFAGALFAKEWSDRGHFHLLFGGLLSFALLFLVYARILKVAELSVVTLGWVIFLQLGIVAMDKFRYDVTLPLTKWAAIVAILLLQAYLIAGPSHRNDSADVESDHRGPVTNLLSQPRAR